MSRKKTANVCPAGLLQHSPSLSSGGSTEQGLFEGCYRVGSLLGSGDPLLSQIYTVCDLVQAELKVKSIEVKGKGKGPRMVSSYCHISPYPLLWVWGWGKGKREEEKKRPFKEKGWKEQRCEK